jgi:hypothetical protein
MSPKERAAAAFDAVETELQSISTWMYENPETAYEELSRLPDSLASWLRTASK